MLVLPLLQVQVEDMRKQLRCARKENLDLLSQLETLSYIMYSIGQVDHPENT